MFAFADAPAVGTLRGIILEQVCEHSGVGQVVDSDDLIPFCAEHLTERETTDTAEAIDGNFYGHVYNPPKKVFCFTSSLL